MPDNNLSSSITALVNQIKTEIPTSSAENLKRLARSIRKLGHSGDSTIDTLINTRANALVASATPSELQILSEAVNLVDDTSNPTAATNVNADVHVSDTAPASAVSGDLWWKTDELNLYIYYEDTDGAQWIQANSTVIIGTIPTDVSDLTDTTSLLGSGGGGATVYADMAALIAATGMSNGDFGIVTANNNIYVYNGAGWDKISSGTDETPVILTEPPTTEISLPANGTQTVTMLAQDPEGFDITYGIAYKTATNSLPSQLSSSTSINQSTGVYTFNTSSTVGSFTARLSAFDGVHSTTRLVDFKIATEMEVLVVGGGGGGSEYGGAGGGASGLVLDTAYSYTAGTAYSISVGSGGSKSNDGSNNAVGTSGGDTTFGVSDGSTIYTAKGGGYGGAVGVAPANGGSGGGEGRASGGTGAGSSTQDSYSGKGFGNTGGAMISNTGGGGGGGAGSAGGDATNTVGGSGGDGKQSNITGTNLYYAAGGAGHGYNTTVGSDGLGGKTTKGGGGLGGDFAAGVTATDGNDGVVIIALSAAAGGVTGTYTLDSTTRSGFYVYTFTGSGTITPANHANSYTVDYLVIGGGGGGGGTPSGYSGAGGGGAGGYRNSYNSETSGGGGSSESGTIINANTDFTLTVGAGGAGGPNNNGNSIGSAGNNSVFGNITSVGGGYGGVRDLDAGNGGSGGGSGYKSTSVSGTGTSNQGYNGGGGASNSADPFPAAGGGGAGGVGGDRTTGGGAAGAGVASSITGSSVTRAAGGAGGYSYNAGVAGTDGAANTGTGGGGGSGNAGGVGGSGVVILRYPSTKTLTVGSGLTSSTATVGSDKVTTFTAGTGTVTFSI